MTETTLFWFRLLILLGVGVMAWLLGWACGYLKGLRSGFDDGFREGRDTGWNEGYSEAVEAHRELSRWEQDIHTPYGY